jgi:hypothetical protein
MIDRAIGHARKPEIGAGDSNRTHDIQLGKRSVSPLDQGPSCKTASIAYQSNQRVATEKQNSSVRVLRAELVGSEVCTAEGLTAVGAAPVLTMCRKLVEAGFDPESGLDAWRGDTLALRVRRIGEAAELEINSKGTDFIRRPAVRRASPSENTHVRQAKAPPSTANDPAAPDCVSALGGGLLVPGIFDPRDQLSTKHQIHSGIPVPDWSPSASYLVDRREWPTVSPHGIHRAEIDRLSAAVHFMEFQCRDRRSSLWWLSTEKGTTRQLIADIQKRITRLQKKLRLPGYNVTVFETRGGTHAHLVFIGTRALAKRLEASAAFGALIHVRPVTDPKGLALKYLAKERTPQAGYGREHILGGRIRGSHRLEGGGDRVRLSQTLEHDAIQAGYVKPWPHKNARRASGQALTARRKLIPRGNGSRPND